ncbi:MAG: 50S ribosomal protein L25 [Patescibacteria group bacterium]
MITLKAKIRKETGKKVKKLREKGLLPGVLYGPKTESQRLEINQKDFEGVYRQAGESSLISLEAGDKKYLVLIHQLQADPITSSPIHVDFFQPSLKEEIVAKVPLVFEGEAPAQKELGGTFVRNLSEVEVKALPQNLPHELRVDISQLMTFENSILIKDLKLSEGVKILKGQDDIVAFVASPEKVEEELQKPIEEGVEEVKTVEKPKKEESIEKEKESTSVAKTPEAKEKLKTAK